MAQAIAAPLPPPRRTLCILQKTTREYLPGVIGQLWVLHTPRAFYDQATQLLRTQMMNLEHENEVGGDDENVDNDNVNDDNLGSN